MLDLNADEFLDASEYRKMALARYAKQSLLQWDDVEVPQIRRWFRQLVELLKNENPVTKGTED